MVKNLSELLTYLVRPSPRREERLPEAENCVACNSPLADSELYQRYRICPACRFHYSISAQERRELLADEGSFREVNRFLVSVDPLSFSQGPSYRKRIFEAQRRTGLTDAVVTGRCTIDGRPVVMAILDFGFMGGSMGCVVGEKVALAFELAVKKRLPLITVVASGGARMQEGILALMQMAKTAAAARRLQKAGLPYISVLANPTTGSVYASFANLADVILAEPGALVGFAPLRVVEEVEGRPLPQGAHTAEAHQERGMIDHVVDRTKLKELISLLLDTLEAGYRLTRGKGGARYQIRERARESVWQTVQLARHRQRPTAVDYIGRMVSNFVEIHGDRVYGDDPSIVCGLGDLSGQAVMVVGQVRGPEGQESRPYPEGFRKAQRAMELAAKFGLAVITFIDTPGAYPGLEAEERGMGQAIASSIALMSHLPTPIISVVIGEGGGEGALALGVADRTLMLENAIYSVISPEGAASILYRDATKAGETASALKLTAQDGKELGVVDVVVPEPQGGAHTDADEAARLLKSFLVPELLSVQSVSIPKLIKARYQRYRRMGEYSSYFGAAVTREMAHLQTTIQERMETLIRHRLRRGNP